MTFRSCQYNKKCYRTTVVARNTVRHRFFILQICGLSWPVHRKDNSWKTILYKCYTIFLAFLIFTVTLFELKIYLLSTINDIEAFANNSFMLLSMIDICGKATNILMRRSEIIDITRVLNRDICRQEGIIETNIQQKYSEIKDE